LIPIAEMIAYEALDEVLKEEVMDQDENLLNLWNKIFHNSMHVLAVHKGLINNGIFESRFLRKSPSQTMWIVSSEEEARKLNKRFVPCKGRHCEKANNG